MLGIVGRATRAVLVLALYLNSADVLRLYLAPSGSGAVCRSCCSGCSWVWLQAHRGQMHDDPLVFAVKDKASLIGRRGLCAFLGTGNGWVAVVAVESWGRWASLNTKCAPLWLQWRASRSQPSRGGLAYGNGRSYGDVCLNPGGGLWSTAGSITSSRSMRAPASSPARLASCCATSST